MNVVKSLFFIISILIIVFLVGSPGNGQNRDQGSSSFASSINQLPSPFNFLKGITLTDTQTEKILQLKNRYNTTIKEIVEKVDTGNIKKEKGIQRVTEINKNVHKNLLNLLTDEQKAVFRTNFDSQNQKNQSPAVRFNQDAEIAAILWMLGVLSPADSQMTALKIKIESYNQSVKELRKDFDKKNPEEKKQILDKILELNKTLWQDINDELTDEQQTRLADLRKSWQQSQKIERELQMEISKLHQKLALTDTQKVDLKAIYQKYDAQLKPLGDRLKNTATTEDKNEITRQIRELINKREQEITALLTPDQQKIYQEIQDRLRRKTLEIQKMKAHEAWVTRLSDELQLSAEQMQKVRALEQKYTQQINPLVQRIQGAKEGDRKKIELKLLQLLTARDNDIRAILTDEQQAKFDELKSLVSERKSDADPADTALQLAGKDIPNEYALQQNFPNPFNPVTEISYQLPEATQVGVFIYSLLGQRVRTLIDGQQRAGYYAVTWDGKDDLGHAVATGVYFYRLITPKYTTTRKMILMK